MHVAPHLLRWSACQGVLLFQATLHVIDASDSPKARSRLFALTYERLSKNAEHTAWTADEPLRFALQFERPPVTGLEQRRVALQRLEDIQRVLPHIDFKQGPTLSARPDETTVPNWVADY